MPFRYVTGLLCPACGGTRMTYDLMHGHFAAAWLDNRALLLAAPFALALWGRWTVEGLRGRFYRPRVAPWVQALILGPRWPGRWRATSCERPGPAARL